MSAPSIPDPNQAAIQGSQQAAQNYPFEYQINALAQMGGKGVINGKTYDFTNLGNADVQNKFQDQMAQVLLDIQQGLGPQFIQQRLDDLKRADPTGYAAYQQLFDQIKREAAQPGPNLALSEATQKAIQDVLQSSQSLTPEEASQEGQSVRGNQVASGIYLGNAPAQAEASAVVGATDRKQAAGQATAQSFLQAGVSPSDIDYRKTQQDMANLGSFISGQNPTAQFSSLSGAQQQAAPTPNTGYSMPTINPGQAAGQGISNAYGMYQANMDWSNNQVNPYMAAFQGISNTAQTAMSLGWSPFSTPDYSAKTTSSDPFVSGNFK